MYIRSKLSSELPHKKENPGSYEWWYFDAMSADKKWAIVIIFYEGNPFSPAYIKAQNQTENTSKHSENKSACASSFPAISVSVYNTQKAEYYSFLEYAPNRLTSQNEPLSISLGSNIFERRVLDEKLEYEHELKEIKERSWSLQNDINTKLEQKEDLVQQLNLDIKRYVGELGKGSQFMHYIHEHDLP